MHRVRPHALPRARTSVSFNLWLSDEAGGRGAEGGAEAGGGGGSGGGIELVGRAFDGLFRVS